MYAFDTIEFSTDSILLDLSADYIVSDQADDVQQLYWPVEDPDLQRSHNWMKSTEFF